jgi:tetratricopeptide (TPR) repeat protein
MVVNYPSMYFFYRREYHRFEHHKHYKEKGIFRGMFGVEKPITEKGRAEIDAKMSYLQRAAKSQLDFDTRKYVLLELGKLYEMKHMYVDAAKVIRTAADITTTFRDKILQFMKAVELHVKGNDYAEAERIFAQALALGNDREKAEMKHQFKLYHFNQAQALVKTNRRTNAKALYQKMLTMELNPQEKAEVQKQLLDIYQRLGNTREMYALRDKMSGGQGLLPA